MREISVAVVARCQFAGDTNNQPSRTKVGLTRRDEVSTFQKLWKNHPNITGEKPLLDRTVYENQCAINLSAALIRSGIQLRGFRGALSWQKGVAKYPIRAQELADWLRTSFPHAPTKFERVPPTNFSSKISKRRGIIFFQNYWGPGRQGDHIDLWNGSRLTDWKSWVRIRFRISYPGVWEDLEKAESVWFWGIS